MGREVGGRLRVRVEAETERVREGVGCYGGREGVASGAEREGVTSGAEREGASAAVEAEGQGKAEVVGSGVDEESAWASPSQSHSCFWPGCWSSASRLCLRA